MLCVVCLQPAPVARRMLCGVITTRRCQTGLAVTAEARSEKRSFFTRSRSIDEFSMRNRCCHVSGRSSSALSMSLSDGQ